MSDARKWSAAQLRAIEERGKNLLVAAAAGSGKTSVLVERIIRRILQGETDVDRLLVVTFTNAAAAEMRERIEAALAQAGAPFQRLDFDASRLLPERHSAQLFRHRPRSEVSSCE